MTIYKNGAGMDIKEDVCNIIPCFNLFLQTCNIHEFCKILGVFCAVFFFFFFGE